MSCSVSSTAYLCASGLPLGSTEGLELGVAGKIDAHATMLAAFSPQRTAHYNYASHCYPTKTTPALSNTRALATTPSAENTSSTANTPPTSSRHASPGAVDDAVEKQGLGKAARTEFESVVDHGTER